MKKWTFGIDNNRLVDLVLKGEKKATTSIYSENKIPKVGEESIICFSDKKEACIIKVVDILITKFGKVNQKMAELEAEGDKSLEYWIKVHFDYFKKIDENFNEESLIIFETFEVIKVL